MYVRRYLAVHIIFFPILKYLKKRLSQKHPETFHVACRTRCLLFDTTRKFVPTDIDMYGNWLQGSSFHKYGKVPYVG